MKSTATRWEDFKRDVLAGIEIMLNPKWGQAQVGYEQGKLTMDDMRIPVGPIRFQKVRLRPGVSLTFEAKARDSAGVADVLRRVAQAVEADSNLPTTVFVRIKLVEKTVVQGRMKKKVTMRAAKGTTKKVQ